MDEVYSWIKNILIYMILNTIIMNLLGNKSYKKYVSIVSGMILVLIVISPIMKLLKLDGNLDYYLQANEFSVETSDFKNDLARMEEKQSDVVFAEYKEKIRAQIETLLAKEMIYLENFEVNLDQDPKSPTFGEILSMNITAGTQKKEDEKSQNSISVDEIEISKIITGDTPDSKGKKVPSPVEIKLKNELADFYNIEQGNINISIQGE